MAVGFPAKTTYANGDVFSASDINDTNGTLNLLTSSTLSNSAGKNAIINGSMDIVQRGTSFAIALNTTTYTLDRWCARRGANGETISQQNTSDNTNLPFLKKCLRIQRNSGDTSTTVMSISQSLETINSTPFAGRTIAVSFYARRGANYSGASNSFNCDIYTGTGTDENVSLGYTGSAQTGQVIATLTTTWQRFSGSVTIPSTATEIGLYFNYTPVGTAGAADYVEITGVQLELGQTPTTFSDSGAGGIQGELAACQRYFQTITGDNAFPLLQGYGGTSGVNVANFTFPVTMRIAPTATKTGTWTTNNCSQVSAGNLNPYGFALSTTTTVVGVYFQYPDNSSDNITFSAEL